MINRYLLLSLFWLPQLFCLRKKESTFRSPLDVPLYLSGTFAELRTDHFHSGIDIRTNGREGLPVYAIADGFVSRVAVAPGGFGKALYVDHPASGHTSVYAHLQRFAPAIAAWAKSKQYEKESFSINIYTEKELFPVKKAISSAIQATQVLREARTCISRLGMLPARKCSTRFSLALR